MTDRKIVVSSTVLHSNPPDNLTNMTEMSQYAYVIVIWKVIDYEVF